MPEAFTTLDEPAKGVVWQSPSGSGSGPAGEPAGERIWMYGISWLFMLDLGQELALDKSGQERKRKRDVLEEIYQGLTEPSVSFT